ncbi:putative lipid II flippase FtsW [Shouchella shacheensis]|uniref:putative lipid II flippase FtsW n=1 Tax=Shouchella shacheensis TaxID=1649580 RepID=UPI0007401A11|nr:putative lipid II flippase FtsW [Shouchella shacheensis]
MRYSLRRDNDWILIGTTFALALFGLLMVFSASYVEGYTTQDGNLYYFIIRQVVWFLLATGVFIVVMHFPFRFYRKLTPFIILGSVVLLALVLLVGTDVAGATRWLQIGPFRMQPSEFVKLGVVIYLAQVYSKKQAYIDNFVNGVMPPLIVVGVIFAMIMFQPDLGTGTAILLSAILLVFFSGARWRHLIGLGAVGGVVFGLLAILEPYRLSRIVSFSDPFADMSGSGWQLISGYMAMANGGLTGTGLGQSLQKLRHLPEGHTDFILVIIAEELGLLGVLFVFVSYAVILFRGVRIGTKCRSPFGSLLAFGIVFQLAIQVIFNIGAVSGMLPITGITLPLVSNGGSSLLITLTSIAILANIARYNKRFELTQTKDDSRSA